MYITSDLINIFNKCSTFDDLYTFTKDMSNKDKGDLFEILTYFLFKLSPFLNKNITNLWMYNDVPQHILKEKCLPSKDKGIDLLFKKNGKYYSIQCKFRQDPTVVVQWKELSTFCGLSFKQKNSIEEGYLVTNTVEMCEEITLSDKIKIIDNKFFTENLPDNFFANIINLVNGNPIIKPQQKTPLPHQQKCITNVVNHFKSSHNNRANIIVACGTGKTLQSYWIDQSMRNKLTLFLVPSLYLLSQFASEIINQSYAENKKLRLMLIGSDKDVDEDTCEKIGGELNVVLDDDSILKFLLDNANNKSIIISTYQSAHKLNLICCDNRIDIDLCIFDEAHKMSGLIDKKFNSFLDNDHTIVWNRLFMTATERIYIGKLTDDDILSVVSMDNEEYFGKRVFEYDTAQAIEDGILTDYCILSLVCTNEDVELMIKENKLIKYKKEFDEKESHYLATILLILKKIHDNTIHHVITYHNTVNRARKFCEFLGIINKMLYTDVDLYVDSFDGSTSMSRRKKIINQFEKNSKSIICSAKVLNEGVNIPITDSVVFVDERNSTVDIQQCCGRAIRKYKGKNIAYIIIPTFISSLDDTELNVNGFGNTLRILKAMKNTDENIIDHFLMNDNKKKNSKRQIIKFEHVSKVNASCEIEFDKWKCIIEGKVSHILKPKDHDLQCIAELKKWIILNKKIPTAETKSKDKKIEKLCDEQLMAKTYNNLKNRYLNMKNEVKLEMENIFGFYIDDTQRHEEIKMYINNLNIDLLKDDKFIIASIAKYICDNSKFPNKIRNSYGNELKPYINDVFSELDILVELLIREKQPVNPYEQKKIVTYCYRLLKNK